MQRFSNLFANKKTRIIALVLVIFLILFVVILVPSPFRSTPLPTSESSLILRLRLTKNVKSACETTINNRFAFLSDRFTIQKIVLINSKYAAGIINYNGSTYRALLIKNSENNWEVYNLPEIVLSYRDFPDIPKNVIETLNNLKGN